MKNNKDKSSPMVILGFVGSIVLAILAICVILVVSNRSDSVYFGHPNPWCERVPLTGDVFKPVEGMFPSDSRFAPSRLQFSPKKFLASSEGRGVIMLFVGSGVFLAIAGSGVRRKVGPFTTTSMPPILSTSASH